MFFHPVATVVDRLGGGGDRGRPPLFEDRATIAKRLQIERTDAALEPLAIRSESDGRARVASVSGAQRRPRYEGTPERGAPGCAARARTYTRSRECGGTAVPRSAPSLSPSLKTKTALSAVFRGCGTRTRT